MTNEITPIFVMGAPRSGTTFLASSIASHHKIVALPEMHYIFTLMEEELVFGKLSLERKIEILKDNFHFCSLKLFKTRDELKEFLKDKDTKEFILELINLYNKKYHKKHYTHWVEHSPHSHRHIDVIKTFFPNAKFIHIIRDPRAVIASTFKEPWGFKDVVTGANSWNSNVMDILKKEKLFDIKTIKYEEFVEYTQKYLEEISTFVGVEFSDSMLLKNGIIVQEYFEKHRSFRGKKADNSRKEKWKKELTQTQISHINARNYKLMQKYDYIQDGDNLDELKGMKKIFLQVCGKLKHLYMNKQFKKEVREQYCKIN